MTVRRLFGGSLLLVMAFASACASPIVYTPSPQTGPLAGSASHTLFVASLRTPPVTTAVMLGSPTTLPNQTVESGSARFVEMERRLKELLGGGATRVVDERDVGATAPATNSYVIRVEVKSYVETLSASDGGRVVAIILGSLTLGLGYLPFVGLRDETTQTAEVEVAIFDAAGAPVAQVLRNGSPEGAIDTVTVHPSEKSDHFDRLQVLDRQAARDVIYVGRWNRTIASPSSRCSWS
jgi:hypothetical protein